jgi:signal peptidase I
MGEEEKKEIKKSVIREYVETIIIAVILALFVNAFVFQAFKIPTGSMEDNLLIGDHIIANKFAFAPTYTSLEKKMLPIKDIKRGDVIVFKYPEDPSRDFIKRVIGLPGEKIQIRGKQVYINDNPIIEDYKFHKYPSFRSRNENYGPVNVPDDCYFVLGDNRDNSRDSRYWGFVPRSLIKGKAIIIYWSFEIERGAYLRTHLSDRIKNIFNVIVHFFTKTRWNRTFKLIR